MSNKPATNATKALGCSAQKYQAIVQAAEKVFIDQGFQKASMDNIAQVAHVSKRTVYNHFSNKNELFHHILQSCCDDLYTSTELPYNQDLGLYEQLMNILSKEWDLYTSDRFVKLARIVIGEYASTPHFIEQFIAHEKSQERGLQCWLSAAIADQKIITMDTRFAYDFLNGSIKAFAHDPLLFDQPKPDETQKIFILNEVISMFLQRYATQN